MSISVKGEVRARFVKRTAGEFELRQTGFESQAVCQIEPANLELTRADCRYGLGNSAAITGIANVGTLPTTAAQWVIWNGEPNGGKTYFFEEVGVYLTSGTPGAGGLVLLGSIISAPAQVGSNVAGASVSRYGKPGNSAASVSDGSKAIIKTGVTITSPAAPNWLWLATNFSANATAFPGTIHCENRTLAGALAIPPQNGLALAVFGPAGTSPLWAPFARWVELSTDNE